MGNGNKILIISCFSTMQVILFSPTLFNIFMYCNIGELFSLLFSEISLSCINCLFHNLFNHDLLNYIQEVH